MNKLNTDGEYMLAYVAGVNAVLDDLKITKTTERKRLLGVAAKKMGEMLGALTIARIEKESEALHGNRNNK